MSLTRALIIASCLGSAAAHAGKPALVAGAAEVHVQAHEGYYDGDRPTSRMGVWFAIAVEGPFDGSYSAELHKDGAKIADDGVKARPTVKARPGQSFVVGGAKIEGGRLGGWRPDFAVPPAEGKYVIRVRLRGADRTETVLDHPFIVEKIATTGGFEPGIAPGAMLAEASLRFSGNWFGQASKDGDLFYMTVPADARLAKNRFDFHWVLGDQVRGTLTREVDVGALGLHTPLFVPVRVFGLPPELGEKAIKSSPGVWQVHVVRDGTLLTVCEVRVEAGRFAGDKGPTRRLRCGEQAPAPAVRASLARTPAVRPTGFRAKEVMALHRSAEVRELRRQLQEIARVEAGARGQEHDAERKKYEAHDDAEWRRQVQRQKDGDAIAKKMAADQPKLRKRYEALVEQHGK